MCSLSLDPIIKEESEKPADHNNKQVDELYQLISDLFGGGGVLHITVFFWERPLNLTKVFMKMKMLFKAVAVNIIAIYSIKSANAGSVVYVLNFFFSWRGSLFSVRGI